MSASQGRGKIKSSDSWPVGAAFTLDILMGTVPNSEVGIYSAPGALLESAFRQSFDTASSNWPHFDVSAPSFESIQRAPVF